MREISIIKIQFGVQIAEEKVYVYMKNAYKLNLYEDLANKENLQHVDAYSDSIFFYSSIHLLKAITFLTLHLQTSNKICQCE